MHCGFHKTLPEKPGPPISPASILANLLYLVQPAHCSKPIPLLPLEKTTHKLQNPAVKDPTRPLPIDPLGPPFNSSQSLYAPVHSFRKWVESQPTTATRPQSLNASINQGVIDLIAMAATVEATSQ
eukprot:c30199_g1_i1 orf=258-635(+)